MKIFLIILLFLIVVSIFGFSILGVISRSGTTPGLLEARLLHCESKPNCVCSEYKEDSEHYIEPIIISQNSKQDSKQNARQNSGIDPLPILKNIIKELGGRIQTERDNYIASYFSSALFGFVDDLEIRVDSQNNVIHIRSASRVGYSDRGVNKKRTELLKERYKKRISIAHNS